MWPRPRIRLPLAQYRSSRPEVFLRKMCSENMQKIDRRTPMPKCNFNIWKHAANLQENTHAEWSAISIKLLYNFIEIALQNGCSPVNLLHIFRTPFVKNSPGRLLLTVKINTCSIIYLIDILYTQVYLRRQLLYLETPLSLTETETQSDNVKTCMHLFSHTSSLFI